MNRDYSYFHSGIEQVPTTSSTLVSSSKYLNHAGLRDWLVTHFLRRNGPDQPIPADPTIGLAQALRDLKDHDQLQKLIDAEKENNPAFKAWLEERYLSPLTEADFERFAPDTFGGRFNRYIKDNGIRLNFGWGDRDPTSDWEFIQMRNGQIHDYEHLMTGGQFNSLGELLPYFVRLSNPFTHLAPELASELSSIYIFGGYRMVMRAFLHYPKTWMTVIALMQRGFDIGLASKPIMMMRYEDALDLPIPEARAKLGFVNAEDFNTEAVDLIFTERDTRER
jgi:ubiquinone biosynthesis protein COQ4